MTTALEIKTQPTNEMIDQVRDIPIYRNSIERNYFPILEKSEIALDFPASWMTPTLQDALDTGAAEFVLSTGTNHARMQIIRPPYFLLNSYYQLWSVHPDIAITWQNNCKRVSMTTVLATDHVMRVNAQKAHPVLDGRETRRLDARTSYLNTRLDPALWDRHDVERMLDEIVLAQAAHPLGWYHLDCSSYHLAHFLLKVDEFGLTSRFLKPASVVHAYEYTPANVKRFLVERLQCPVIDLFGSTELGYLYFSDITGRYTPYLDQMSLELVPIEKGSSTFSLIVSSIRNPFMPLIRYRSGDCVQTLDNSADPSLIRRFCGREKELVSTSMGLFSQADLDDCINGHAKNIFLYQLNITDENRPRLDYCTFDGAPIDGIMAGNLRESIFETLGLHCDIIYCGHIPIGKSGKYAWRVKHDESTGGSVS